MAIVLAAGPSRRMGTPKQLLEVGGKPMLEAVLGVFREAKVDRVLVVLGANAGLIKRKVRFLEEEVVVNRSYEEGMSGSLKLGLEAVSRDADAVIIALADQPFLTPATVDRMIEGYLKSKAPVVVAVYQGERGNPVLFDRAVFPEIMKIKGDVGAKSVVRRHEDQVLKIEVEDRGVMLDIDTPSDYRAGSRGPTRKKRNQAEA